jgi:hypothetical protein
MRTPAMAGPMSLPALMVMLFSVSALVRCSRPTISARIVCLAGLSRASTVPITPAITNTIHNETFPVAVSTPRTAGGRIDTACVQSRIRRLFSRSASRPPQALNSSVGSACTASVSPRSVPESVSSSTSHAWVIFCVQVPTIDMVWPEKNSRKFRLWSEANVARK